MRAAVPAPRFARPGVAVVWLIGSFVVLGEPLESARAASAGASAAWLEVREMTACEAMKDEYCRGRHGFTIKHDGAFLAGPSSSGSKAQGRIERMELRRLRELIGQLSATLPGQDGVCDSGGFPGIKDRLDIMFSGGLVVRAYDLGSPVGRICYVGDRAPVDKLHEYFRALMTRYYPVPFPGLR
jgi:hypothetical protein